MRYRTKPLPGSFGDLIMRYRRSPRVLSWAPATMRKNDATLERFMSANHQAMVADLRRGGLIAMRDSMASTPSEANNWMKVIRGLLAYAVDLEMIQHNPATGIKRLKVPNPDGYRTWAEHEIAAYIERWPLGTLAHRCLTVLLYTGAARIDAVRLGPGNVRGDRIRYRREKMAGGPWIDLPILPPLAEVLASLPPQTTFLQTEAGRARSHLSLTNDVAKWARLAGLGEADHHGRKLSPHGLRKAFGRRLAEAGCSPHEIMAILGHTDLKQAAIYTAAYDRARSADSAADKLLAVKPGNVVWLNRKE